MRIVTALSLLLSPLLLSCDPTSDQRSLSTKSPGVPVSTGAGLANSLGRNVYVDPSAILDGIGTQDAPHNSWASVIFQPGYNYYQKAGTTYIGVVTVNVTATATEPVTIGSYSTGAKPIVTGSFNFYGASYVTLNGFSVTGGTYASTIIQNGSSYITIQNCDLTNSALAGVNITNNAGGHNLIQNNTISGHDYYGVVVHEVDSGLSTPTVITNNVISKNKSHGIEIKGNNFVVTRNTLTGNGYAVGGSSGIHVYSGGYSGDPFTVYGAYNLIAYNSVSTTVEPSASDGNGIELDQETHDNQVLYNYCYDNQGAGINLYDAYNNSIRNNLTYHNTLGTALHSVKTELMMTGSAANNANATNTITGNTFMATVAGNLAVYVDGQTAAHDMVMSGNTLVNSASSAVWSFNSMTGNNATFNSVKWANNAADTVSSGTPSAIGPIPAPTYWNATYGTALSSLGYTISWY